MSNNWSQQPPDKQSNGQDNPPPRTGGLLSNYARQPAPSNAYVPQTPPGGASNLPVPSQPGPTPQLLSGRSGLLASHRAGFVSNTLQVVRGFSGKMAAIAGHPVQPPAPPLERYRQPEFPEARPQLQKSQPWRRSRTIRIVRQMRNRRDRWHNTQPGAARIMQWLAIALGLIIVIVSAGGSAYTYNLYQSGLPQVERLANQQISQTTRIYDRNMVPLYDEYDTKLDANSGRRTVVSYSDIPQIMQDAMISTEDHTFWTNQGIDPQATLRSALQANGSGASGITQQVVKNLSGNTQHTLDRKIVEAAEAIGLTQQYSKQKILEMYFNVAPFGSQDLGVEAAVEDYFHLEPICDANFKCVPGITRLDYVSAQDPHDPLMALARASLLAGIPQSPSSFDPTQSAANKAAVLVRQDHVLNLMMGFDISYGPGLITPDVIKKAEKLMTDTNFQLYQNNKLAPHFVDWIVNQVETVLGNGDPNGGVDAFLTGGFNIRTTIDVNLEKYVENAVTRHLTQAELQKFSHGRDYGPLNLPLPTGHNVNDAAVVIMNSKTGEILAMNGSSDYYNNSNPEIGGQVNVATQGIGRQPGSSFKPFVYATAFEMGWYPGMVLPDVKTYFPNGEPAGTQIPLNAAQEASPTAKIYVPQDYSGYSDTNPMTVRLAVANSYNVPAVKALEFAGIDNVVNTAERMGVTALATKQQNHCQGETLAQCFGVSLVLGTTEVPLLQMVGAYQVFADQGMRVPPQGILDIWDNYGHNLVHYDPNAVQGTQVLSPEVAYMMTSILQDEKSRSNEFSGDHDLSFYDQSPTNCDLTNYQPCSYQVAAKTGTSSNFIDNLTIGYTPGVVVGVWAGNADGTPMNKVIGITGAAPIWHSVMEFASHGWCNDSSSTVTSVYVTPDQVPCPNVDRTKLGINTQNTFTPPADLVQGCISNYNGLQGCGHTDWMLANEAPQQSGMPPANPNANNGANGSPTPTN